MEFLNLVNSLEDKSIESIQNKINEIDGLSLVSNGDLHMVKVTGNVNSSVDLLKSSSKGLIFSIDNGSIRIRAMSPKISVNIKDKNITLPKLFESFNTVGKRLWYSPLMDGTNIRLYFNGTKWAMATYSSLNETKLTKQAMIQMKINRVNFDLLNKNYCYHLIFCGPTNRIIVNYEFQSIHLIGIFNCSTLKEYVIFDDIPHGFDSVIKRHKLCKKLAYTDILYPGILLVEENGTRYRFDSNRYQLMSKVKNNTPLKYRVVELCSSKHKNEGELNLFISLFPEIYNEFIYKINMLSQFIKKWTLSPDSITINCRLNNFLDDLIRDITERDLKYISIEYLKLFILNQDPKRITFLTNTELYQHNDTPIKISDDTRSCDNCKNIVKCVKHLFDNGSEGHIDKYLCVDCYQFEIHDKCNYCDVLGCNCGICYNCDNNSLDYDICYNCKQKSQCNEHLFDSGVNEDVKHSLCDECYEYELTEACSCCNILGCGGSICYTCRHSDMCN